MQSNYAPILQQLEPFLIAGDIREDLNLCPGGVQIPSENVFHPQHRRHAAFLAMLQLVDRLTFGPFGMEMPSWVFYDCAVMPGAVFGLGVRAHRLEEWAREAMKVPDDYEGLVPVSQFIAIPMLAGFSDPSRKAPGTWLLYTLESLNQVSPGMAPVGTLKVTCALGLRVFPIRELYAISQWRSPKLEEYVELGPLELVTAWTPAHSMPRTLSFRLQFDDIHMPGLVYAPSVHPASPPPNALLDVDSAADLQALQRDLEAGEKIYVVGKPIHHGASVRVPLYRSPGGRASGAEPLAAGGADDLTV